MGGLKFQFSAYIKSLYLLLRTNKIGFSINANFTDK